jgi:uncharacterized DUF497 family protein
VTFEWDARKAAANFTKHAMAFEDAATVFLDPPATTFPAPIIRRRNAGKSPSAIQ